MVIQNKTQIRSKKDNKMHLNVLDSKEKNYVIYCILTGNTRNNSFNCKYCLTKNQSNKLKQLLVYVYCRNEISCENIWNKIHCYAHLINVCTFLSLYIFVDCFFLSVYRNKKNVTLFNTNSKYKSMKHQNKAMILQSSISDFNYIAVADIKKILKCMNNRANFKYKRRH